MNTDEFVQLINKLRLDHKDKWFWWSGTVNGKQVDVKCYNTYLQIFTIDGLRAGGLMGMSVTKFKDVLREGVE